MEDLTEQLARRDRLMRAMAARMTYEERIARGKELCDQAFRLLAANPEAFDRFYRRNLRERALRTRESDHV